jgi:hypothetical protein
VVEIEINDSDAQAAIVCYLPQVEARSDELTPFVAIRSISFLLEAFIV